MRDGLLRRVGGGPDKIENAAGTVKGCNQLVQNITPDKRHRIIATYYLNEVEDLIRKCQVRDINWPLLDVAVSIMNVDCVYLPEPKLLRRHFWDLTAIGAAVNEG